MVLETFYALTYRREDCILHYIEKLSHKVWSAFVVGKGTRSLPKTIVDIWKKFWEEIDRILGMLARQILKMKTPIVPNKVFFHTQESKYTCNPKYICEELQKQCPDIDIVWRVPNKGTSGVPDGIRTVKLNTFMYFKEIFSSKVVITNSFLYMGQPFTLKKDQVLIETWHGSLGIKRHDKKAIKDTWRRVYALEKTGKMTTYCISNSDLETSSLRSTYWSKTPILEYGHPRNDLFFPQYKEKRDILKEILFEEWGLPLDTQIAMYAPTFRDNKNFDCYNIDFQVLVEALKKRFGGEWCILLRYHPSLSNIYSKVNNKIKEYDFPIINVTKYLDMQELIAVTDIAITDYSSWIYDFVLLRKPGFIFATDIKDYNNERGFYYPLEETPFSIAQNNSELQENILLFDQEIYSDKVENFLKEKGCIEDGHASERVVELIKQVMK